MKKVKLVSVWENKDGNLEFSEKNDGQEDRYNFMFVFIGVTRSGKSITAREIAIAWKQSRPNSIIVSHDPQNKFSDISDMFLYPTDKNEWVQECMELRNALIILDDYRIIHENAKAAKGLGVLFTKRAEYNLDFIIICHNPALVINLVTYFTTHYYMFYTESTEGSFSTKIPNYKLAYSASRMINAYVSKYGRGKEDYPKFPHIVANCEKRKLTGVNVDKVKLKLAMVEQLKANQ